MINTQNLPARHSETLVAGEKKSFCRCWQSTKHPYCDGTHRRINEETGDNLGPVSITAEAVEQPAT